MGTVGELREIRTWRAHPLRGNREGDWSLHVTPDQRPTFRVDDEEIADVDVEDYH